MLSQPLPVLIQPLPLLSQPLALLSQAGKSQHVTSDQSQWLAKACKILLPLLLLLPVPQLVASNCSYAV